MRRWTLVFVLLFGSSLACGEPPPQPELEKLFEDRQYDVFVKEATRRADRGDSHAQFLLGKAYHLGRGVSTDLTRARELYSLAAKQDHPRALNNLALIIHDLDRKPRAALKLIERAVSLGLQHPAAMHASTVRRRLCEREREVVFCVAEAETHEALWDADGAETSLSKALSAYETGCTIARADQRTVPEWAVPPDQHVCALAIGLAERGAARGIASAAYVRAGLSYEESNYADAIRWFTLAHERGSAEAAYALGFMHMNGHGSVKSEDAALTWYRIAASRGSRHALDKLVDYWEDQSIKNYDRGQIEAALAELVKLVPERDPSTWKGAERLEFMDAVSANARADHPSPSAVIESHLCYQGASLGQRGDWQLFELGRPEDIDRIFDALPTLGEGTRGSQDCIRFDATTLGQIRKILARGHTPTLRIGYDAYLLRLISKSPDTLQLEVAHRTMVWGASN